MAPKKSINKPSINTPDKKQPIIETDSDDTSVSSDETIHDEQHHEDDEDNDEIIDDDEINDDAIIEKNDDIEIIDNDECVQAYSKKNDDDDDIDGLEMDDMIFDNLDEGDITQKVSIFVDDQDRITRNVLTEAEYVRLLCVRATQIAYGAESTLPRVGKMDPKSIAQNELQNGLLPLFIIRRLPDGTIEKINPNTIYKKLIF